MSGNDPPGIISFTAGQEAIIGGFTGAIGSTIIGGIIGLIARKKFAIGAKRERFDKIKSSIVDRLYGSKQQ